MARRKDRFKFHGKCQGCAGPTMRPSRDFKYCERCEYLDAVDRLAEPQAERWWHPATDSGVHVHRSPNVQQVLRYKTSELSYKTSDHIEWTPRENRDVDSSRE